MNILVLNPPNRYTRYLVRDLIYGCWCKGKRIGNTLFPPLNLLYIATVLKESGFSVKLLDALGENKSLKDVNKEVKDKNAVVLSTDSTTFNEDARVIKELKETNPNLKVIMCGPYPTMFPEYALKKSLVDFAISGEAETTVEKLMMILSNTNWKSKIRGMKSVSWKENEHLIINREKNFIKNLNDLPFPDRSMLKGKYYNPIGKKEIFTTALTSRGCNGTCIFCTAPSFYENKIRYRTSNNVIEELRLIKSQGYDEILFRDETFTLFKKRNEKICKTIIKEKLDISWICNLRVGTVNKDMMKLMKRAGCHTFKIGVESGSQKILNNLKKGITIKEVEKTFKLCKRLGVNTHAHLMIGCPGETKKTVEETIQFLKKIEPDTIDIGILTPFPGTKLFEIVKEKTDKIGDGTNCGINDIHNKTFFNELFCELSKEDIEKGIKMIYRWFYTRPNYIFRRLLSMNSPSNIIRSVKAGINILQFSFEE